MMQIDAVVEEQDTHLVLGPVHPIETPAENYADLIRQAVRQQSRPAGTVWVITRRRPARVLAVVHDLDADPSCREEWVENAYVQLCAAIQAYGFRVVALPLLGTVHGGIHPARSMMLLEQAVTRTTFARLEKLLIIRPDMTEQALNLQDGP